MEYLNDLAKVKNCDEALLAAAKLSCRHLPGQFLPNKAMDLVDEACAKLNNESTSKPTALVGGRETIQLEMEKVPLSSDQPKVLGSGKRL